MDWEGPLPCGTKSPSKCPRLSKLQFPSSEEDLRGVRKWETLLGQPLPCRCLKVTSSSPPLLMAPAVPRVVAALLCPAFLAHSALGR